MAQTENCGVVTLHNIWDADSLYWAPMHFMKMAIYDFSVAGYLGEGSRRNSLEIFSRVNTRRYV